MYKIVPAMNCQKQSRRQRLCFATSKMYIKMHADVLPNFTSVCIYAKKRHVAGESSDENHIPNTYRVIEIWVLLICI